MDRKDNYSLQALDFTKHKMEQKVNEDLFSVALDLSMRPSEPNLSTCVDESRFAVHSNIQTYLNREQRLWDSEMSVAKDLRVVPESSSAERFGCSPSPARKLKGNKLGGHNLKQHELKVNQLIERKMKDYGGRLTTKLFNDCRNNDDNSGNALLSFNFKESLGVHSEDVGNTSAAVSLDSKHRTFPFAGVADVCCSRELLEKHISAFEDDNGQNRQTVLRCSSETSLSEIARSSFGQSEESCEFQGKQQYDEYARQFSDFLKSTAHSRSVEQCPLSSSEVSQADEADTANILAEESSQPDAEHSILIEKEACVYAAEDGSFQQSETRLDEEECNDKSLVESKSEIAINNEPNDAENGVTGKRKRKQKVRDIEISESQSSRPKKKKTSQVQFSEAGASLK